MKNTDSKGPWWKPGIVIFIKVSGSIAIPILLALFIGKYLDEKYRTEPFIFMGLIGTAFLLSTLSIWKSLSAYINKIEKEEREKK